MVDAPGAAARSGRFASLLGLLDPRRPTLVQTHDYPDIDAVASAWALSELLGLHGIESVCVHRGEIRSRSLSRLLAELNMRILSAPPPGSKANIIVVDCSPTNGNVELFPGDLIAVIDHHRIVAEPSAPFVDIRTEVAACATIVRSYWEETGAALSRDTATALLAGIQSDTDFLSSRASAADFEAYIGLFCAGDWDLASRIVKSVLSVGELGSIQRAIRDADIRDRIFYAIVADSCSQEVLAVLADFALRVEEIDVAVTVAAEKDGGAHVSVRSKNPQISAFELVREALAGIGSGGGHSHSAGGIVAARANPGSPALKERFFSVAAAAAQTLR
ncbi:MAG TPA: DHH family phosphoesterase [Rectinemataceae bacterium]|nr:DHH family phosphoesterase [Rectinemataceae bacterium]